MTKLQIALDVLPLQDALELVRKVHDSVDIIEIGTPFLIVEGLDAVRAFRKAFPDKQILVDAKIADGGTYEATKCFEAGGDYVTVLGRCDPRTIQACVDTAREFGKHAVVDMLCVPDPAIKARELMKLGVDCIELHTGVDQQESSEAPIDDLAVLEDLDGDVTLFVAGGINLETIDAYRRAGADVVICGGAIAAAEDPAAMAAKLAEKAHGAES